MRKLLRSTVIVRASSLIHPEPGLSINSSPGSTAAKSINAYYNPSFNEVVFRHHLAAAVLRPERGRRGDLWRHRRTGAASPPRFALFRLRDDDLEVFAGNDERTVFGNIEFVEQG